MGGVLRRIKAVVLLFVFLITSFLPLPQANAGSAPYGTPAKAGEGAMGGGVADTGFYGEYFPNMNFEGEPSFTRKDVRIDFDWQDHLPIGGSNARVYAEFPKDHFSVRWTGRVIPKYSETYFFQTYGDGGVRLWIKEQGQPDFGTPVIDEAPYANDEFGWSAPGEFPLQAGQFYDLKLEYTENTGCAGIKLTWGSPSTAQEVIEPVMEIGQNVTHWGQAFVDIVKSARNTWEKDKSDDPDVPMDENGWPMADCAYVMQESLRAGLMTDPMNTGLILYSFKGRAEMRISGGNVRVGSLTAPVYDEATNTSSGSFIAESRDSNATFIGFRDTQRDPNRPELGAGITDLKLMAPIVPGDVTGEDGSYTDDVIFHPLFKEAYANFTVLRVNLNNANQEKDWEDRTKPTYFNQNGGRKNDKKLNWTSTDPVRNGPSWEHKIMLCNEIGKDLYINIPIMATGRSMEDTNSYVYQLANLIKYGSDGVNAYTTVQENPVYPPLNPNLRVYAELSNEVWNSYSIAFLQYWDLNSMTVMDIEKRDDIGSPESEDFKIINYDNLPVVQESGGYNNMWTWRLRKAALRLIQISEIFRGTFGDEQMMSRIRPVYEWQYGNGNNTASIALEFINNYFNNASGIKYVDNPRPVNYYIWGGGGASYYGAKEKNGLTDILPDGSFESPVVDGYEERPGDSLWTFEGNAGIARNGSSLNNPNALIDPGNGIDLGSQVAYIQNIDGQESSMSITFTIPEDAPEDDMYEIKFKAHNRIKQGSSTADEQNVRVYVSSGLYDNEDIFQRTFSNSNGYRPPGYSTGNPWRARNVSWVLSDYYATKIFTAVPGEEVTIKFAGKSQTGDNMIFIDDVRLCTSSAIISSEMPYKGEATGQVSINKGYLFDMKVASLWANAYGLQYITYEGGWSLGGDDGGSPLQNYAKYQEPKTKNVQKEAVDLFHQANGRVNIYGTYPQWPSWSNNFAEEGMLNIQNYPIMQGIAESFSKVREESVIAEPAGIPIDGANCLEKGFSAGEFLYFRAYNSATATYFVDAEEAGEYALSAKVSTNSGYVWLEAWVNQEKAEDIRLLKKNYLQDSNGMSESQPITVMLKKGVNAIKLNAKDITDTTISSVLVEKGAAAEINPLDMTLSMYNNKVIDIPAGDAYKAGDIIRIRADEGVFTSASSSFDDIASVMVADEGQTLEITCHKKGMVHLKAVNSLDGTNRNISLNVLIGYAYPKGIEEELIDGYGYMPLIFSSTTQYSDDRNLLGYGGDFLTMIKEMDKQFVIRRFNGLYRIDDIQLNFESTSWGSLLPSAYKVELLADPYPAWYESNPKILRSPVTGLGVNIRLGDFTDYYDFSTDGRTHFGGSPGVIKEDFSEAINSSAWRTIYEGTSADFAKENLRNVYTAIIDKEKIEAYLQSAGTTDSRQGYFIRVSYENEEIAGSNKSLKIGAIAINAQKQEEAAERLLQPQASQGRISMIKITNNNDAIYNGVLAVGLYAQDETLTGMHIFNIGQIGSQEIIDHEVDIDLTNAHHYKVFLWDNINQIQPLFPIYSGEAVPL